MQLVPHPSPNFGARREGALPELVVIHYTAMASCGAALERLCDPVAEVSAHYLIDTDGSVLALVPEEARAWHAGAGDWGGRGDVNSRSIGVELANDGMTPFAAAQMVALDRLLEGVMRRWSLPPQAVIAHSDMAPARKGDPGRRFDWRALARRGLSVWPEPSSGGEYHPARFADLARAFGYGDHPADLLLGAVRLRFRPWARGPGDRADMAIIADLAQRFAVDRGTGAA